VLLPDAVDDYVDADNPVRFVDVFVDELDFTAACRIWASGRASPPSCDARPRCRAGRTRLGVHFIPARDLQKEGVDAALEMIPDGSNVIVSLDADALDPSLGPAVIGRSPGGLSYDQVTDLIRGAPLEAGSPPLISSNSCLSGMWMASAP
jgi:Arginase family